MKSILAWHWSDGLKCRYDDRPIVPGQTLVYKGEEPIELCLRGLHASTKILDALAYAPGTTISRVRLSGEIIRGTDKIVATHRTCLWSFDAKYTLISWSADCAERALLRERKAGREPDPTCFEAIEAARRFVEDPSEENQAAAFAARNAAGAASNAAGPISYAASASHCAASASHCAASAARDAAYSAYYAANAAGYAVWAAGRAVSEKERKWQSARLRNLIAAERAKI